MSQIGGMRFQSPEELLHEIERLLKEKDIMIVSKKDCQWHFIIEIGHRDQKISRLKVHYNKKNTCNTVEIITPMSSVFYKIVSEILPISKENIRETDYFCEFLNSNYHYNVEIIHSSKDFTCYDIKTKTQLQFVWVKVLKGEKKSCIFVNGDTNFYDEIKYLYEEDILQKV